MESNQVQNVYALRSKDPYHHHCSDNSYHKSYMFSVSFSAPAGNRTQSSPLPREDSTFELQERLIHPTQAARFNQIFKNC